MLVGFILYPLLYANICTVTHSTTYLPALTSLVCLDEQAIKSLCTLFRQFLLLSQSNCLCFFFCMCASIYVCVCVCICLLFLFLLLFIYIFVIIVGCCCCCHMPSTTSRGNGGSTHYLPLFITLNILPNQFVLVLSIFCLLLHAPFDIFVRTHLPVSLHFVTVVGCVLTLMMSNSAK